VSPTQRTLAALRANGWHAEIVERWIPGANIRKDLWGFADIFCLRNGSCPLAVQCTSASNVAARVKKITESPLLPMVRAANIAIEVWGWRKLKASGWQPKIVDLS
jgi:hypothetical protein